MKITKRQLRRIIKEEKAKLLKEEIDPRLKGTHHDPRYQEGPPGGMEAYMASKEAEAAEQERARKHDQKTLDFINPAQQHIQKYLDQAQQLNLKVVENTPRLLLVQGLEDDLVEFDAYFNEMEGPQVANSFYKTASKKDIRQNVMLAMKPVTEIAERKLRRESKMIITKRQLKRIIKEEKAKILKEAPSGWDNFSPEAEAEDEQGPDAEYLMTTVIGSVSNELANLADGAPPEEYPGEWKETVESLRDWLGEVLGKW